MDTPNSTILLKRCTKCRQEKPATTEYFYANQGVLVSSCKACNKKYRDENRERLLAKNREWCKNNREKRTSAHRDWRAKNRERSREINRKSWAKIIANDPSAESEKQKRKYQKQKDKYRAYGRQRYANNRDHYIDYGKRYREENPAKIRMHLQNRRARENGLPNTMTGADWQRALDYFNDRCAVCGRPIGLWHTLAADHWIPVSDQRPGNPGTVPTNIVPLCHGDGGCNNRKSSRDPIEFLETEFGKRKAKQILARIHAYFDSIK